jgi:integrase
MVPVREQAVLEREEIVKVLEASTTSPGGVRWVFALAMGARQSEVLGLTWDHVDLEGGSVDLTRQLQRHNGRWALVDVKSEKGRRRLPLPAELVPLLREHRQLQLETRLALGAAWKGSDLGELVFPTALGRPVHRSVDRKAWVALLEAAGVRRVRVHDARHTAATVMLEEGVDLRVVQEWLGHSSYQLTAGTYQHVTARLERDAASRVGAALWPASAAPRA